MRAAEGFGVEQLEPLPSLGHAILGVGTARVLGNGQLSFGLFGHYEDDPLTASTGDRDTTTARFIDSRWTLEAMVAVGILDYVELGVVMPLVLAQSGDDLGLLGRPGERVDGVSLGDLRVIPKVRFIGGEQGLGLHLAIPVIIPTGDPGQLTSDGGARVRPTIGLDYAAGGGAVALNVGYEIRSSATLATYTSDDVLRWSVGGRIPIVPDTFSLLATVQGAIAFADQGVADAPTHPIEALGGVELNLGGFVLSGGGGAALVRGVGAADVRGYLGLGWTPAAHHGDELPEAPSDRDGDGLPDDVDKCADFAEDKDGFQDDDGCPDPDDDFDGVPDVNDKCPREAEDYLGAEDGCPEKEQAPPANPDPDNDKILGDSDKCPDVPEDMDGFQDDDGCPDPDNDGDGVPDASDKCPSEPESKNGFEDDDGCPDANEPGVTLTKDTIEIKQQIVFGFSSDKIHQKSFPTLDSVARVLQQNTGITKLSIEGHTDSEGPEETNLELSTKRAAAVRQYLVDKGVAPERLVSTGYGESKPKFPNTTPFGRAANRRVEFHIVAPSAAPATPAPVTPAPAASP